MSSIVLKQAYKGPDGVLHDAGETISVPYGEGLRLKTLGVGRYLTDPPEDDAATTRAANVTAADPTHPPGLTPEAGQHRHDQAGQKKK